MVQTYGPPTTWSTPPDVIGKMWPHIDIATHFAPENHGRFLLSVPAFLEAPNSVWRLRQMGVQFFYFTATKEIFRPHIKQWLEGNLFPPAELRMADSFKNKGEALKEYTDIQAIIDDSPEVLNAAADLGIHCYVFDRFWNREVVVGTRVVGWTHLIWQLTRDLSLFGLKGWE